MAAWTTLILLASVLFILEFHLAVPDPYLICGTTISLFAFYNASVSGRRRYIWWMYLGMAFGFLAKGPVAVILPGLCILAFLATGSRMQFKNMITYHHISGLVLFLVFVLPWFYLVHEQTGGKWTEGFFLDHNLSRFREPREGHGGSFFLTMGYVILGLFPFSIFLPQSIISIRKYGLREDPLFRFCLLVVLVTVLFFGISGTKLPNYTMPAYPFAALLIAAFFNAPNKGRQWIKLLHWGSIPVLLCTVALPVIAYFVLRSQPSMTELAGLSWWFLVPVMGCLFFLWLSMHSRYVMALVSFSASWLLISLIAQTLILPALMRATPVAVVAANVGRESSFIGFRSIDSAFPFNFQQVIPMAHTLAELQELLARNPGSYVLTNERDAGLDKDRRFELIIAQPSPIEHHTTRVFRYAESSESKDPK